MYQFILDANGFLWGTFGVAILILIFGIYATIRLRVPWVRHFKDMIRAFKGKALGKGVTPFKTVCVAVGAQVGTGNLIGVSTAIASGGPGALFWMWVTALLGMSTIMVETLLGQLYKEKNPDGTFRGGAAFYIGKGLNMRWLGVIVALIVSVGSGFANAMSHTNAICDAVTNVAPISPLVLGIVLAVASFVIVIGGFRRVSGFASKVVPFMCILYIVLAIWVLVSHITAVPAMFAMVFKAAFNFRAVGGGVAGYTVAQAFRYGMARGIFSNEAGQGSTPHQSSAGAPLHPAVQGFLGASAVAIDTLLVCTATGIIILLSGVDYTQMSGAVLAQAAFKVFFGDVAPYIIAIALFFFAFTSLIASFYGGATNISYITTNKKVRVVYMAILAVLSALSSLLSVDFMFEISDFTSALMVLPNIIALFILFKQAKGCLEDFEQQQARGIEHPVYDWAKFRSEHGMQPWDEETAAAEKK